MNNFIEFTHANTGKKVLVAKQLLFAFYYSEAHASMFLLASGGAIIPVKEKEEEILKKLLD